MSAKSKTSSSVVEFAEIRTARTMAVVQSRLVPNVDAILSAEDLSFQVAAQLAALPKADRGLLRQNIALSIHDLDGLVQALESQMTGLALELRKVSSHSDAATAYGRQARRPCDHRS